MTPCPGDLLPFDQSGRWRSGRGSAGIDGVPVSRGARGAGGLADRGGRRAVRDLEAVPARLAAPIPAGGHPGLADRSRRPRTSPSRLSAKVEALICDMRRQHPRWGARRISYELGLQGVIRPRLLARRRWASAVAHSAWPYRNVRSPEHAQQRGLADLLDALAPGVSRFPGWIHRRQSRPAASVRSAILTARSCATWRLAARELSGANMRDRRIGPRRSRIRCRDSPWP